MLDITDIKMPIVEGFNGKCYIGKELLLSEKIYRYTSLANLLMILGDGIANGEMPVFSRCRFSDRREKGELFNKKFYYSHFLPYNHVLSEEMKESWSKEEKQIKEVFKQYASCWTLKKEEDFLMWKSYAGTGIGVRIGSSVQKFLQTCSVIENYNVYGQKIVYDRERREYDLVRALFLKTSYYEYEKEVRFYFIHPDKEVVNDSLVLKINPEAFIDELVISPFIHIKVQKALKDLLLCKYGFLEGRIIESKIMEY